MKFGYFLGIKNLDSRILHRNLEEMMMEDFMEKYKIEDAQNVFLFPNVATEEFRKEFTLSLLGYLKKMKIEKTLLKIISELEYQLPELPELPAKTFCQKCNRNLPEPDGFMGVYINQILHCFKCYNIEKILI